MTDSSGSGSVGAGAEIRPVAAPGDVALSHVALAAAARVAGANRRSQPRKDGKRVPGEPGVWVFIFGDMTLFAVYFGVFLASRNGHADAFRRSQAALHRDLGAVNTLVLLSSSLLVVLAVRASARGARRTASRLMIGAAGCGVAFVGIKIVEYSLLFHSQNNVGSNPFFRYYLTLTGIHLAHVVLGTVLLVVLSRVVAARENPQSQRVLIEGGACWWHMVDLIWVVLFPLVYLAK